MALRCCGIACVLLAGTRSASASEATIPSEFQPFVLSAPIPSTLKFKLLPTYWDGMWAVYRVTVNQQTGGVASVVVLKHSRETAIDKEFEAFLHSWKFKPASIRQIDIPLVFSSRQLPALDLRRAVVRK